MSDSRELFSALRSYIFDYAVGVIWTLTIILAIPNALAFLVRGSQHIATSLAYLRISESASTFFAIVLGVLLPYCVGLTNRPFGHAFTQALVLWFHRRDLPGYGKIFDPVKDAARHQLNSTTGCEVPQQMANHVAGVFLRETGSKSGDRVLSALHDVAVRLTLSLAFLALTLVLITRFGPASLLTCGLLVASAIALFLAHVGIEHALGDELHVALLYAVVISGRLNPSATTSVAGVTDKASPHDDRSA